MAATLAASGAATARQSPAGPSAWAGAPAPRGPKQRAPQRGLGLGCVPRRAAARPPARTAARAADEGLASDLGLDSARVERLEGQQDTPSLPSLRGGRQRVLPHERKDRATPFYGRAFVPWEAPSKRLEVNSPHRSIEELVAAAGLEVVALEGDPTLEVTGVCADSRQARPGELFVCVRGLGSDGHAYARAALDAGCVALVVEDGAEVKGTAPAQALLRVRSTERAAGALAAAFYGFPGDKLACVGVTGTNGKTTVSTLIAGMYENLMMGSALIGTVGINVGGEDYPSTHTTPDAVTIQRVLAAAAQADAAAAVMEVSSHALALGRVDEVDFDVAIFTNLTRDHLDFHETEEEYLKAKLKLFERLDDPQRQRAIINVDDPHAQRFIDAAAPVPVITFSMRAADEGSTHADVYLKRDAPIKLYEEELELGEDDPRLEEVDWQGKPLYELVRADEGYEEPPLLLSPEDLADDINEELAKGQTRAETLENSPPEGSPEVDAILQEDAERMHEAQEKFLHTQLEGAARQMNPTAFDPKGQASEYMRYRAVDCKLFDTRVDMWTPSGEVAVLSGLLGHTNVYNLLAAVAFGHTVGFSAPQIEQSIESIDGVPGRFELVDVGEGEQNFAVVVDYAHTPDALERLLKSVRQIEDCARVITVVGCGGDRDRGKRPEMGRIAWENSDMVFFTSDNPRTEEPQWVIDDMLQGIDVERYEAGDEFQNPPDREHLGHICQYFDVVDREDAIRLAVLTANTRDVVVIAGKGHETYIEIGKTKYRFDDREVAANAIRFSEETKEVMPWLRSKWEYPMSYDDMDACDE